MRAAQKILDEVIRTLETIRINNGFDTNLGNSIRLQSDSVDLSDPSLPDPTAHVRVVGEEAEAQTTIGNGVTAQYSLILSFNITVFTFYDPLAIIGDIKSALSSPTVGQSWQEIRYNGWTPEDLENTAGHLYAVLFDFHYDEQLGV